MEFLGIEDQFFTATFLPASGTVSLWHWTQDHKIIVDNKPDTEPEAEMAAGTTIRVPLRMRVSRGPEGSRILSQAEAVA